MREGEGELISCEECLQIPWVLEEVSTLQGSENTELWKLKSSTSHLGFNAMSRYSHIWERTQLYIQLVACVEHGESLQYQFFSGGIL